MIPLMDRMYQEDPTRGTRRYVDDLAHEGYKVGRDKVRRLMQLMAIAANYRKPRTTVMDPAKYKYPYLLRGLVIISTGLIGSGRLTSVSFHCERDSCTWWLLSTFIVAISWVGTFPTPWMLNGSWFVSNRLFLDMELLRSSTPTKEASLQVMSILET